MQKIIAFNQPVTPAPDIPMQGNVIRNFTPNWFATTMGTGILSVALAQFPGHSWLFAMGQALWLFNILLFAICTALYAARWTLYFHEASRVFPTPSYRCSSAASRWDWPRSSMAF